MRSYNGLVRGLLDPVAMSGWQADVARGGAGLLAMTGRILSDGILKELCGESALEVLSEYRLLKLREPVIVNQMSGNVHAIVNEMAKVWFGVFSSFSYSSFAGCQVGEGCDAKASSERPRWSPIDSRCLLRQGEADRA